MSKKYELIDFIFFAIKEKNALSVDKILENYESELNGYGCDKSYLNKILDDLVTDEKIFEDSLEFYRVSPKANDFKGYQIGKAEENKIEIKKRNYENWFKIIPIILTILFGLSTLYFNSQNNKNAKELENTKQDVNNQIKTIDSLKSVINLLNKQDSASHKKNKG